MNDEKERFLSNLYVIMYDTLLRFANAKLGNIQRAEEIVQDAFIIAQQRVDTVMDSANANGWMVNTVKYLLKHEYRARQKAHALYYELKRDADVQKHFLSDDYIFELSDMFAKDDWELLFRVCIEGVPIGDITLELGIEYDACKKRLQKLKNIAKQKLIE